MLCVFVVNADLLLHVWSEHCFWTRQHTLNSARASFGRSELKVLQMKIKEDFKHAEDEFSSAGCPNHRKHRSLSLSLFISAASKAFCLLSLQISKKHSVSSLQNHEFSCSGHVWQMDRHVSVSTPRGGYFSL